MLVEQLRVSHLFSFQSDMWFWVGLESQEFFCRQVVSLAESLAVSLADSLAESLAVSLAESLAESLASNFEFET